MTLIYSTCTRFSAKPARNLNRFKACSSIIVKLASLSTQIQFWAKKILSSLRHAMGDNNNSLSVRASTCEAVRQPQLGNWGGDRSSFVLASNFIAIFGFFLIYGYLRPSRSPDECAQQKKVTQRIAHLWKWSQSKLINRVQSTETARQLLAGDKALSAGFRWMNSPVVLIQQKNKFYDFIIYWRKKKTETPRNRLKCVSHRWCRDSGTAHLCGRALFKCDTLAPNPWHTSPLKFVNLSPFCVFEVASCLFTLLIHWRPFRRACRRFYVLHRQRRKVHEWAERKVIQRRRVRSKGD